MNYSFLFSFIKIKMNNSKLSKKSLKLRSLKLKNKRTKKSKKSKISKKNFRKMKGGGEGIGEGIEIEHKIKFFLDVDEFKFDTLGENDLEGYRYEGNDFEYFLNCKICDQETNITDDLREDAGTIHIKLKHLDNCSLAKRLKKLNNNLNRPNNN